MLTLFLFRTCLVIHFSFLIDPLLCPLPSSCWRVFVNTTIFHGNISTIIYYPSTFQCYRFVLQVQSIKNTSWNRHANKTDAGWVQNITSHHFYQQHERTKSCTHCDTSSLTFASVLDHAFQPHGPLACIVYLLHGCAVLYTPISHTFQNIFGHRGTFVIWVSNFLSSTDNLPAGTCALRF